MANVKGIYPLATTDGKDIPLDVASPLWASRILLTGAGSGPLNLPSLDCILACVTDVDCYIRFGGAASVPGDNAIVNDQIFLPRGVVLTLLPTSLAVYAISVTGSGTLRVSGVQKWAALSKDVLVSRK